MNTFFKRFAFVCAVAIPSFSATAQVTISQADVNNIVAVGHLLVNRYDTVATSINIGSPGATSFNFSGLLTNTQQTYTSVAVSGTPFASNFPGATNSFKVDTTLQGISGTIYQYLTVSPDGMRNLGNMARVSPFPFTTVELKTTVTPPEIVYGIPSTFGTSWHTAFTNNVRITLNGQELSNTNTSHDATYRVDAYGPMTLPGTLGTYQALRIRKLNLYTNSSGGSSWVLSYLFIARNGALVLVEATDTLQGNSGVININPKKTQWNGQVAPTDVRVGETIPSEFGLAQNYPNPFNPSTTISYQVAETRFVSLKVYNMLGQEVATLVDEVKAPGVYQLKWNAEAMTSGVYFYTMRTNNFTATKRLVLLK